MRLLIAALAALPLTAATAEAPAPAAEKPARTAPLTAVKECPKPSLFRQGPGAAKMHKLIELPPAEAFHAVYRLDKDGCVDPVLVGYQYGRRR